MSSVFDEIRQEAAAKAAHEKGNDLPAPAHAIRISAPAEDDRGIGMINQFDEHKAFMYENGFYLTSMPYRMGNLLAHYELYKKIIGLPGAVIELGVFKGGSLIQWATFRELLENENSRKIVGFDIFGEFPETEAVASDQIFTAAWNEKFKDEFLSKEDIEESLKHKNISNIELVKGNILETLPSYVERHKELRIALLHIDTDVYEPCKLALELLFDRLVVGGVVVFDDYAVLEGETRAVDEFFNGRARFSKFSFSHVKPTYIVKGSGAQPV